MATHSSLGSRLFQLLRGLRGLVSPLRTGIEADPTVWKLLTSTNSEKDTRFRLGLATHSPSGSRLFQLLRALFWALGREVGLPLVSRQLAGPSMASTMVGKARSELGSREAKS